MYQRPSVAKKLLLSLGLTMAFAIFGQTTEAHTRLSYPTPRDQETGYKPTEKPFVMPCGIARAASQMITPLPAGSMQTIKWEETVSHPGCWLIEFAKSDAGPFVQLSVYKHPGSTSAPVNYTSPIKMPAEACTGCVLRIRQVMMDNNTATCPPKNLPDNSELLYYSCANITLTGGDPTGSDGGTTADAGTDGKRDAAVDEGSTGTGGSSGNGGNTGIGGSIGNGGTTGIGGSSNGGNGGSGGAVATGGSSGNAGSGGKATGGNTGSGGRATGGSTGSGNDSSSLGGCSVGGNSRPLPVGPLFAMFLGLLVLSRRRR